MSLRVGMAQRIIGTILAVIIVLALDASLPQSANAKDSTKFVLSPKNTSEYYAKKISSTQFKKVKECQETENKKICFNKTVPLKVPVSSPTNVIEQNLDTSTLVMGEFISSKTSKIISLQESDSFSAGLEQLPKVLRRSRSSNTTTTTTSTSTSTTTSTTTTTTTSTTTTTTSTTTTTTTPSNSTTPGPSNRNILVTSGPITITTNGAVVQNVNVQGQITIAANNVTLRNFRANNVYKNPGNTGLLMEYGEIHGEQNSGADGVVWSDYTARYLEIKNVFDGFKAHGNVLIENCWVHDLLFRTGADAGAGGYTHNDAVQVSSGSNVTIRNNKFERNQGNSAIFIDADQGSISNVLVEGNTLGGGGFTLYSIQSRSAPQFGRPTNVIIRNNTFTEEHLFDYATIAATGTTWSNNRNVSGALINSRIDNF